MKFTTIIPALGLASMAYAAPLQPTAAPSIHPGQVMTPVTSAPAPATTKTRTPGVIIIPVSVHTITWDAIQAEISTAESLPGHRVGTPTGIPEESWPVRTYEPVPPTPTMSNPFHPWHPHRHTSTAPAPTTKPHVVVIPIEHRPRPTDPSA